MQVHRPPGGALLFSCKIDPNHLDEGPRDGLRLRDAGVGQRGGQWWRRGGGADDCARGSSAKIQSIEFEGGIGIS